MKYYYRKNNSWLIYKAPISDIPDGYVESNEEEYKEWSSNRRPKLPNFIFQIQELQQQLAATDYKAIKYAEGLISEEDYQPIKEQRQALRDQINQLRKDNEESI